MAYCIAVKSLEKINSLLEEIWNFFLWCVARIARRLEGADTSPVLAPLVFPERFVVAVNIDPIRVHI